MLAPLHTLVEVACDEVDSLWVQRHCSRSSKLMHLDRYSAHLMLMWTFTIHKKKKLP